MGMAFNDMKQSDIYLLDKTTGNKIPLFKEAHVLGRASEDINFQDPAVSRQHCRMYRRGNQFFLEDLNSVNKTFVNNLALQPHSHHLLHHGDIVRIGRQTLIFANRAKGIIQNAVRNELRSLGRLSMTAPLKTQVSFARGTKQKTVQIVIASLVIFTFVLGSSFMRNQLLNSHGAANRQVASVNETQPATADAEKAQAPAAASSTDSVAPALKNDGDAPVQSDAAAPTTTAEPAAGPDAAPAESSAPSAKNFEPPMENPFEKPSARNDGSADRQQIAAFPEINNR